MPSSPPDFSNLSAVFINATLKRSPDPSNTDGLITKSADIMRSHGVAVTEIRAIDHQIATGVYPDMTEHGWDVDEWPGILDQIMAGSTRSTGASVAASSPAMRTASSTAP